jgi:predicted kinase
VQTTRIITITRGVPGAGKSSFCQDMAKPGDAVLAADDFFYDVNGNYNFDASKLHYAHKECQRRCEEAMVEGKNVFINNTCIKEQELTPYRKLAEEYGYKCYVIVLENRHGGKNQHGVPEAKLVEMERNLKNSIKLR